jgi:hypothetical protein
LATDEGQVAITGLEEGSNRWLQVRDGEANGPLGLAQDVFAHGTDTTSDRAELSIKEQQLPLDVLVEEEFVVQGVLARVESTNSVLSQDAAAEVGDKLVVRYPAVDTISPLLSSGFFLVGQSIVGSGTGDAIAIIEEVYTTTAPDRVWIRMKDVEGEFKAGMTVETLTGEAYIPSSFDVVAKDSNSSACPITSVVEANAVEIDGPPSGGLYEADITRKVFRLRSQSTALDASIQVLPGTTQAVFGFPLAEVRGESNLVEIEGVDLSRTVQPPIRVGDLIYSGDTEIGSITSIDVTNNQIGVSPALSNNEDIDVNIVPLGAADLDAYRLALDRWWVAFKRAPYGSALTVIKKNMRQARYAAATWVDKYKEILQSYDDALAALIGLPTYRANRVEAMLDVLDGLEQNRLTVAKELLESCRIREYMELGLEGASNWTEAINALKNLQDLMPAPADPDELDGFLDTTHWQQQEVPPEDITENEVQNREMMGEVGDDDGEGVYG